MLLQQTTPYHNCPKKLKAINRKITLPRINATKFLEQSWKTKNKRIWERRQNYIGKGQETLTTDNNIIDASMKDLSKKGDTSKITYYNYNKKNYYASTYIKLPKN